MGIMFIPYQPVIMLYHTETVVPYQYHVVLYRYHVVPYRYHVVSVPRVGGPGPVHVVRLLVFQHGTDVRSAPETCTNSRVYLLDLIS